MEKKGFVFIETVTVLIVVTVSLSILLLSYSLIVRNANAKKYYDRVTDKYMTYSIYKLGKDSNGKFEKDNINEEVKNEIGLKYIYEVNDIQKALKDEDAYINYINGAIEYMKTLQKCNTSLDVNGECSNPKKYLICVYNISGNYYYASIEI